MREDFKGLSQHTPLASIAASDHAVSRRNIWQAVRTVSLCVLFPSTGGKRRPSSIDQVRQTEGLGRLCAVRTVREIAQTLDHELSF